MFDLDILRWQARLKSLTHRRVKNPGWRLIFIGLMTNLLLLSAWVWLFRAIFPYLATIFSRQEFRTNQILLVGVLILLFLQVRKGELGFRLYERPRLNVPALLIALFGSIGYLLVERFFDINTLSAGLFGLASYGMLGLWFSPTRWRQGLPAALLLIGTLPIGEHMDTFIGYPLRMLSATVVRDGISALGIHSLNLDTILIFENGISQVDLPCSGVKSLWTGSLFVIAVTWIERHPINWRWLAAILAFGLLLIGANILRVGLLVLAGPVSGWDMLAEMLHVPLGVFGFVGACLISLLLLRWAGTHPPLINPSPDSGIPTDSYDMQGTDLSRPVWLAPVLIGLFLVLGWLYQPRPPETVPAAPQTWDFPASMAVEAWPLSPQETDWLASSGDSAATRWRFHWEDLSGTLLFVSSTTWRAQHRPEYCLEVLGFTIEDSQTHLVAEDFPLRLLNVESPKSSSRYSAAYWFQSIDQVTDDYGTRMWADLSSERGPWVLVTVLFDDYHSPLDQDYLEIFPLLRQTIAGSLAGGLTP
jgi:exosortase O